jgi:RNase P subunit RPR2
MFQTLPEEVAELYCTTCEKKTLHRRNLKVTQGHQVSQLTCKECGWQEIR